MPVPLRTLNRTIQDRLTDVLNQRFFHDRLSMTVLAAALSVNLLNMLSLLLKLRPTDAQVPVHFSSFRLFDQLGPWYFPLEVALGVLVVTLVNAAFAFNSFTRSRLASFFLLVTSLVVGVFGAIISQAFGAVR